MIIYCVLYWYLHKKWVTLSHIPKSIVFICTPIFQEHRNLQDSDLIKIISYYISKS